MSSFPLLGLLLALLLLLRCAPCAAGGGEEGDLGPELEGRALEQLHEKVQTQMRAAQALRLREEGLLQRKKTILRVRALRRELEEKRRQVEALRGGKGEAQKGLEGGHRLVEERQRLRLQEAESRKEVEREIVQVRRGSRTVEERWSKVEGRKKELDEERQKLEEEERRLIERVHRLVEEFRQNGLERWLHSNVELFPQVVRATLLRTGQLLGPVVGAVEEVAQVNERLTEEVAEHITQYLPLIRRSPFYSGMLFYVILLCPLVLVTAVLIRIRYYLSRLIAGHWVMIGNLYFGTLSVVCFLMSLLGGTEIIVVFQHRSRSVAETFIALQALGFVILLWVYLFDAWAERTRKSFGQLVCYLSIGIHFFIHAVRRSMLHLDVHIGLSSYFIYAVFFLYTLYDKGVDIVQSRRRRKHQYPNGVISTRIPFFESSGGVSSLPLYVGSEDARNL